MSKHSEAVNRHYRQKRDFISRWKAERGCRACGENDPIVLDLNHVDPADKNPVLKRRMAFGQRQLCQLSWANLALELEKCEVLCANCHRRVTHAQRLAGLLEPARKEESPMRLVVGGTD